MMSALAQWSTVDPGNMSDVDVHIQQTNDRLQCIQQHLLSPNSFPSAARELLEWCSDTRAFQWQFEQRLMGCLTVVSQVAGQFGYDLDLGYRLLAVCAAHRDKLTPKSAGLLSLWCEDLGRLLLLRHHKVESSSASSSATASSNNSSSSSSSSGGGTGSANSSSSSSNNSGGGNNSGSANIQMQNMPMMQNHMMMQNGGNQDMLQQWQTGQQLQKSLSAGATGVWGGMSQSTQQNMAYSNTRMPSNGGYSATNAVPYNAGLHGGYTTCDPTQKSSFGVMAYSRQPNVYNQQNGFVTASRMNCAPDGATPPDAMSAAAMAAAATVTAAATATAAASVICIEQGHPSSNVANQFAPQMDACPQQQYVSNCYGSRHPGGASHSVHGQQAMSGQSLSPMEAGSVPNIHCGQMPMKGGGPGAMQSAYGAQRRPVPYPNPQQYMQSKRGPYPNSHHGISSEAAFGVQSYAMAPQYGWNKPGYVQQQHSQQAMPVVANFGSNPRTNMSYGATSRYIQPVAATGQCRPYNQQFSNMQNYPMNNQTSPIFDNLTPPMTPAAMSSVHPYVSPPSVDSSPSNKPMMTPTMKTTTSTTAANSSEDLRLMFPVRDGVILPPFRLEHNLAVSNHVFHLRDSVYQTLMWRSDLELQLKCFHHEDHQMNTNWPASVTVSVNATPLSIERGENKSIHRPLYLKDVCQPGRNTIQITVTACCCSHLFVLQLVHRPSVKSVLQGLLRKRLLPAEHCITKIKRSFNNQTTMHNNQISREEGVEQTAIKLSLKCPITYQCIALPVRGHDCKHIQCFDLESYLRLNCDRGTWRCPICNKPALLEGLEIDQYIWGILQTLTGTPFEEVTIDTTASWKPVPVKNIKEEEKSEQCIQRWKIAVSPASMKMPTMTSWQDTMSFPNPSQSGLYPLSPHAQSFYNSPSSQFGGGVDGGGGGLGPNPCFPPSSTPDVLSCLTQMGDNLLTGGAGGATVEKSSSVAHQRAGPHSADPNLLMHPPTPMDGLHRNPGVNGHCGHPHTPGDVHADGHPGTPLDGQGGLKLHHATPGTPSSSNSGNPHTPSNASALCGSIGGGGGGPVSNSAFDQSGSVNSNIGGGVKNEGKTLLGVTTGGGGSGECGLGQMSRTNGDFCLGLNFDSASILDGDSQGQEVLDLLPDNIGDPTELLSYLGPMDNMCNSDNNNGNNNDDLLSLFS